MLDAIAADPRLTARQRKALAEIYESFIASSPAGRRTSMSPWIPARKGRAHHRGGQRNRACCSRPTKQGRHGRPERSPRPDPDGPGTPYQADLTDAAANEAAVNEALNRFGRLDVVVANAGIQHVSSIEDFPVDKWNHDRFADC